MSIWADAEVDAADLAELVNGTGFVTTRYGSNPKRTWQQLQDEFDLTQAGEYVAISVDAAERAENAAENTAISANIYDNITQGIANTVVGEQFQVLSADGKEYIRYRHDVGDVATEVGRFPTGSFVNEVSGRTYTYETFDNDQVDKIWVLDIDGRIMLELDGQDQIKVSTYETFDTEYVLLDADNKVLISGFNASALEYEVSINQKDINNLSSSVEALNQRVNKSLNDYGLNRTHVFGEWYLREFRQRSRKLKLSEDKQLVIANIGDSWTHRGERYSTPLGLSLQSILGGTSAGFTGFSWGFGDLPTPSGLNGNYDPSTTSVSLTGSWVNRYSNQNSPDICSAESSIVGDTISVTTSKIATSVTLYAEQNGAVVRYRFDGGAWTSLTLNNTDDFVSLTGLPLNAFTLDFEVVSGTVNLYGVDMFNDDSGVIVHKLGATGTQLAQWASRSAVQSWKDNLQNLAPDLITILHGTNDQTANYTKAFFKSKGQDLINNIRSVLPLSDILLVAPCENGRVNSVPMSDYQDAFQELAYENKCAFINLQHVFGDEFSEYASTSPRNWFNADLIHPEPLTGGRAIVDVIERTLLNR